MWTDNLRVTPKTKVGIKYESFLKLLSIVN